MDYSTIISMYITSSKGYIIFSVIYTGFIISELDTIWCRKQCSKGDASIYVILSTHQWIHYHFCFLHDRQWMWISRWIKSISNELYITFHVIVSQWSRHFYVTSNRSWHHQDNVNWASDTKRQCVEIPIFIIIYGFFISCKNKIMYILLWWTVHALTWVLFSYISRIIWNMQL